MQSQCLLCLDAAHTLAEDIRAQLEALEAVLASTDARQSVPFSSREAYGFGLVLGSFAHQLVQLEAHLERAQRAWFDQAGQSIPGQPGQIGAMPPRFAD